MNDIKNETQTNINADYAGPPKAHDFRSDTGASMPSIQPPPPKIQMPPQTPENVLLNEDDVLLKNDGVSIMSAPTIDGNEANNELLKKIKESEEIEARQIKKKIKVKKEPTFDWKKINLSQKWIDLQKKVTRIRRQFILFKQEYKDVFHLFDVFWGVAKFCFYCVGLSFFALCFFVYFSFEPLLRRYLDSRDLSNVTFSSINYSLSELSLKNIKEKNGLFTIGSIKVQYTFADLLKRKIPSVIIDSMKIYIQEEAKGKKTSQEFVSTLWKSGLLDRNFAFSIQSLRFENSVLYVGNKAYKLPVNFSGIGSLGKQKNIVFPISLQNDYLSLKANVSLNIAFNMSNWDVEIVEGTLFIPGFERQSIKGKSVIQTRKGKITALSLIGSLTNENISKDFNIQVVPASANRYSIKLDYTVPKKTETSVYTLNLSNIMIAPDLRSFETVFPVFFKATNIHSENLKVNSIQVSANGLFKCTLESCFYKVQRVSDLIVFNPSYTYYDTNFSVFYPLRTTIETNKEKTLVFKDGKLIFDIVLGRSVFDARRKIGNSTDLKTNVALNSTKLQGFFELEKKDWEVKIKTTISKIDDKDLFLSNAKVDSFISSEGTEIQLQAQKAKLKTLGYFKPEVKLEVSKTKDNYFVASIETPNKQISSSVNGYYHPYTGGILMAVQTNKPIEFKKSLLSPQEISSLFSNDLKDVTGKLSVKGQIHYEGKRMINGPIKVKIENASFKFGNTKVDNLNTILHISQLVPFGTQGGQHIYAKSIKNALPFENAYAQVFFDASRKQFNISSLTSTVAGYHLSIEPMWYNYGAPIYNFTLKGKTEPIQNIIDKTTLKDLKIIGNGSISVSTQLEDSKITLKSCELSVPIDGYVAYTPKVYPIPYLENLKHLDFKKLSIYLTEQDEKIDLIFSADNKANKLKKKTNFRFTIKEPLDDYIKPTQAVIPDVITDEKEKF